MMRAGSQLPRVPRDITDNLHALQDKAYAEGFEAGIETTRGASLALMLVCTAAGAMLGGLVTAFVLL